MKQLLTDMKPKIASATLASHSRKWRECSKEGAVSPPVPSVSPAQLPPERPLTVTQHEVRTSPGIKGIPDLAEALPRDRGPQNLWGFVGIYGESSGCVRTQGAAITPIPQLTLTAQPLSARTASVTQTAQAVPPTAQTSDTERRGMNGPNIIKARRTVKAARTAPARQHSLERVDPLRALRRQDPRRSDRAERASRPARRGT